MQSPASPVAITTLGATTAAGLMWRRVDRMFVTVVIKGTFSLVADGPIALADPEPVALDEERGEAGLRRAGDLAPYQAQTDVLVVGHVDPSGEGSQRPPFTVGIGVNRAGAWLMSKRVSLPGRTISGLGPVSRRHVGFTGVDGILTLPDPFDWSLFQAAPPDQRVDALRGQEWIALSGVYPSHPVFMTHLAGFGAAAKLYGQAPNLRAGRPIPLVADTLQIDADRRRCAIVWRGQFPISGADALPYLHVVAGVEIPGRPLVWTDPFQGAPRLPPPPVPPSPTSPPAPAGNHRFSVTAPPRKDAAQKPATPFEPPAPAEPENKEWFHSTLPLTADQVARLLTKPALPFEAPKPPPRPASAEATASVDHKKLGISPVIPFSAAASEPPAPAAPAPPPPPLIAAPPPLPISEPAPAPAPPPPAPAPPEPPRTTKDPPAEAAPPKLADDFLDALPKDKEPRLSPTERLAARRRKPKDG